MSKALHHLCSIVSVTTWALRQQTVLNVFQVVHAAALPLHIPWHRKGLLPLAALYPAPKQPLELQTLHTAQAHHYVCNDSQWLSNFKTALAGQKQQA